MSPSPPLSPDSVAINLFGFDFDVTIHWGMDWDRHCLPQKFMLIVGGQEPHEIGLRVAGGATIMWSMEEMFDLLG
jgi:hypothetical protein